MSAVQGDKTQEEILLELGSFLELCGAPVPGQDLVRDWTIIRKAREVPQGSTGPVHHDTYYLGNGKRYRSRLEVARSFGLGLPEGGAQLSGASSSRASHHGGGGHSAHASASATATGLSHPRAVQSLDYEGAPRIDWSTTPPIAGLEELSNSAAAAAAAADGESLEGRSPLTGRVVPIPVPFSYPSGPPFGVSPPLGWGPVGGFLCMLELRESIGFEAFARIDDAKDSPLRKCASLIVDYDASLVRFRFEASGPETAQEFKHVKRRIALLPLAA